MDETKIVLDSFAWFEYFYGSDKGIEIKGIVESGNSITPSIVIAELTEKYRRMEKSFVKNLLFIKLKSVIVSLSEDIAKNAGEINFERKKKVKNWGMSDSIVLATARSFGGIVITGDEHFKDLDGEVRMLS